MQKQTAAGISTSGTNPDVQKSPKTCAGTCSQCREAAQQRELAAKSMSGLTVLNSEGEVAFQQEGLNKDAKETVAAIEKMLAVKIP